MVKKDFHRGKWNQADDKLDKLGIFGDSYFLCCSADDDIFF